MDNEIVKIPLVIRDGNRIHTLFDSESGVSYIVPLYQRAFAWGTDPSSNRENEIVQLMDDIYDSAQGGNYYLGSLIVAKKANYYEVIDGQQRLTALFLLFHCLGLKVENGDSFRYACREKSNYAMRRIKDLIRDESLLERPYEKSIYDGIKTIMEKIRIEKNHNSNYEETMKEAFQHVFLFRICVPEGTDLNRYFEVMNTRGEQLEQHDIVKAKLMSPLSERERSLFSEVWNACRDMSGYVQMHFCKERRETLFQSDWAGLPDIRAVAKDTGIIAALGESLSVSDVISPTFKVQMSDGKIDDGGRIRFESIIGFTHFLLHVLKVFIADIGLVPVKSDTPLVGELLDDQKLIASFENVRTNGIVGDAVLADHDFSWKFLDCLLKCRFLFDKYIIKREFKEENSDGEWSLKELKKSGSKNHENASYNRTEFREPYEREPTFAPRKDEILMMQACLRVSYTSPKVMHWITRLLLWLYEDGCSNTTKLSRYLDVSEEIAIIATRDFLEDSDALDSGVNTPHIVLNFLDYLLWLDKKKEPFSFEFRNSVEHWYPQHPSDGMFGPMDRVDRFGNLCLIQSNTNAKFSNLSPESKKSSFKDMIAKGSLKLRIMSALTTTAEEWRTRQCDDHQNAMILILENAITKSQKINQGIKEPTNDLLVEEDSAGILNGQSHLSNMSEYQQPELSISSSGGSTVFCDCAPEGSNEEIPPEHPDVCILEDTFRDQFEKQRSIRPLPTEIPPTHFTMREFISVDYTDPDKNRVAQVLRRAKPHETWLEAPMTFRRGLYLVTMTFGNPIRLTLNTGGHRCMIDGKTYIWLNDKSEGAQRLFEILHKPMSDFVPNITDKQPQRSNTPECPQHELRSPSGSTALLNRPEMLNSATMTVDAPKGSNEELSLERPVVCIPEDSFSKQPENNIHIKTNPFFESFVNYCTTNGKLTGNWIPCVTNLWADYVWRNKEIENGPSICFTAKLRTQVKHVRLWTWFFKDSSLIDLARQLVENLNQDLQTQGIGCAYVCPQQKIHIKTHIRLSEANNTSFEILVDCHRKLLEFIETVKAYSRQNGNTI